MKERAGRVEGKVALVTGAGSTPGPGVGTGKATSIALAREGAKLVLVDLNPERAEDTKRVIEEEGGEAIVVKADCTNWRDCAAMVMAAVEKFGTLDILVNNLGLATFGTAVDTHPADWERTININMKTVFFASKFAIPVMAAQKSGSVINVSSVSAQRAGRTLAYTAAKAGVEAMTFDMALAHGRQGVRVNCIMPGNLVTPIASNIMSTLPNAEELQFIRQQASMIGTPGNAWDIAHAAVYLASEESRWVTGVTLPVDAGSARMGPLSIVQQITEVVEARIAREGPKKQ